MHTRLGFSIAMEIEPPDVLLLDEVMSVGDVHFAKKSYNAIKQRFQSDATVVFITHDARATCNLCERVIWIEDGQVRMIGEPKEVTEIYEQTA